MREYIAVSLIVCVKITRGAPLLALFEKWAFQLPTPSLPAQTDRFPSLQTPKTFDPFLRQSQDFFITNTLCVRSQTFHNPSPTMEQTCMSRPRCVRLQRRHASPKPSRRSLKIEAFARHLIHVPILSTSDRSTLLFPWPDDPIARSPDKPLSPYSRILWYKSLF
jgi:hypothetical protein